MSATLGTITKIEFPMFHKTLDAKVDTGATTCCLHGTNIVVKNNNVSFSNSDLSPNVISMPVSYVSDVHSAGHQADERPVVQLNVSVNGVVLENIDFNINDRSQMDCNILLGQNLLKRGNFVVDVSEEEVVVPVDINVIDPTDSPLTQPIGAIRYDSVRKMFVAEFTLANLQSLMSPDEY